MPLLRPDPNDPSKGEIMKIVDVAQEDWILPVTGDFNTFAAETMKKDGSGYQRVIGLIYPGRTNKSNVVKPVQLMFDPEDAFGLAKCLLLSAATSLALQGVDPRPAILGLFEELMYPQ